jgi:prolipoprotein diacylglyceryltransferase
MSFDPPILLTPVGIVAAALVARRRAIRFGLEVRNLHSLIRWLLIGLLVGGHLVDALSDRFERVTDQVYWHSVGNQPADLLRIGPGWSSVGGLFGGLAAALLWRRYRFESTVMIHWPGWFDVEGYWFVKRSEPVRILALADVVLSVFPLAWALHRVGTVLARDRTDIGLFDLSITLALLAVVVVLWKGRFQAGFYVCLAGLTYAPARVAIGFLNQSARRIPATVGGLTVTQYGFAFATLLSLGLLIRLHRTSALSSRPGVP